MGVRDEGIARSDSVEPMGWSDSPKQLRFEQVTNRLVRALRRNHYQRLLLMTGRTSVSRFAETQGPALSLPPSSVEGQVVTGFSSKIYTVILCWGSAGTSRCSPKHERMHVTGWAKPPGPT